MPGAASPLLHRLPGPVGVTAPQAHPAPTCLWTGESRTTGPEGSPWGWAAWLRIPAPPPPDHGIRSSPPCLPGERMPSTAYITATVWG